VVDGGAVAIRESVENVKKRLFIAVDIDAATREQIGGISNSLRAVIEPRAKASWVRPDRLHLTLHFFGYADAEIEQRLRGAFGQPIAEAPFDVSFSGLGFFPQRGSPRVLWLGVAAGLSALRRIHAISARDVRRALPEQTTQPFTPHLTVARFRDRTPRAKLAELTDIPPIAGPSRIDRVTLYESRLSPGGPTYLPLAEALLRT
jgi:RNA 2',3'-cyclic 3'-phosphodiesterase